MYRLLMNRFVKPALVGRVAISADTAVMGNLVNQASVQGLGHFGTVRSIHIGTAMFQKGKIAVREPVKVCLTKGKQYNWCACGHSKKQPYCDGSHKSSGTGINPISFTPQHEEVVLCQCKQTNNRPYCDGSHLTLNK